MEPLFSIPYHKLNCKNWLVKKARINKFLGQRYKEDNIKTDRKISKYKMS